MKTLELSIQDLITEADMPSYINLSDFNSYTPISLSEAHSVEPNPFEEPTRAYDINTLYEINLILKELK